MNNRERAMAILNYQSYDRMPVVHFAFWEETVENWVAEGHVASEEAYDHNAVAAKLGFDFDWFTVAMPRTGMNLLYPPFERKVIEELPDGGRKVLDDFGVIHLQKDDATGIPMEFDHTLKDRASWEEHFLHRLVFSEERMNKELLESLKDDSTRDQPVGLFCGSLIGEIRDAFGVVGLSYIAADDPDLLGEIINTWADLYLKCSEYALQSGAKFDFGHFWEDICYKSGPLVSPVLFRKKIAPHYKRFADLLTSYGINIVSLDCDGKIDALIPSWLENGVNTMFPIEVGTWNASIAPWREKFGRQIRGVGGMDKKVFAYDFPAIDAEIERLRALVDLGGFIPCPDHRIAPDAKWDNVRYYCDRMHKIYA